MICLFDRVTRVLAFTIVVALFFKCVPTNMTVNASQSDISNVALGKPVTAVPGLTTSSNPGSLTDGVTNQSVGLNKWYPEGSSANGAWAEIDLQGKFSVSSITMYNGYHHVNSPQDNLEDFRFEYFDGVQWSVVPGSDVVGIDGFEFELELAPPVTMSKFKVVASNTQGSFRLREIEIFGEGEPGGVVETGTNVALNKPATAIELHPTANDKSSTPTALTDGVTNQSTGAYKWFPENHFKSAWAEIDLQERYKILSITMYNGYHDSPSERLKEFRFLYYQDDVWQEIPETVTTGFDDYIYTKVLTTPVTTTKIRIESLGTQNSNFRIREIEIYGISPQSGVKLIDSDFEIKTSVSSIEISNPSYTVEGAKFVDLLPETQVDISFAIKRTNAQPLEMVALAGVYNPQHTMENISYTLVSLQGDDEVVCALSLALPQTVTPQHYIRVYLWDGITNQFAFSEAFAFPTAEVVESAWHIAAPWSLTSDHVQSGMSALKLEAESGGRMVYQMLEVKQDTQYNISFYARGDARFDFKVTNEMGQVLESTTYDGEQTDWTQYSLSFNSSQNDVVKFCFEDNYLSGVAYIDNLSIVE